MSAPEDRPTVAGALAFMVAAVVWLAGLAAAMEALALFPVIGCLALAFCLGGPFGLKALGCSLSASLAISALAGAAVSYGLLLVWSGLT